MGNKNDRGIETMRFHFFSSSHFLETRVLINPVGIDREMEVIVSRDFWRWRLSLSLFSSKKQGEATFPSKLIKMKERWKIQAPLSLSSSPSSFIEHGKWISLSARTFLSLLRYLPLLFLFSSLISLSLFLSIFPSSSLPSRRRTSIVDFAIAITFPRRLDTILSLFFSLSLSFFLSLSFYSVNKVPKYSVVRLSLIDNRYRRRREDSHAPRSH